MTEQHVPSFRVRALLLAVGIALVAVVMSSDAVHGEVMRLLEASRRLIGAHPVMGPMAFVMLSALSAMLAFFSSAVLISPAVYAWGPVVSALLLWIGWLLGGVASYALARWIGRPAIRWLARGRPLAGIESRITRDSPFSLVLLFQLALPSEIPGVVLGLTRYPLSRYMLALALAELPYAVGTMLLGVSFVERRAGALISLGAVAVLAGVLLTGALRRRMRPGSPAPGHTSPPG